MVNSVLALDLATTTGWAWHSEGMPRPFFGAFKLPGEAGSVGQPADALERWLRKFYLRTREAGCPITHYMFEAQHIAQNKGPGKPSINIETAYRLITLGGIVEKFAWQTRPQVGTQPLCFRVPISTWRKHFIGRGAGFKRDKTAKTKAKPYLPGEDPKQLAIEQCARYGWHTDVADAAEAAGILDYGLSLIKGHPRPWRDELLMK